MKKLIFGDEAREKMLLGAEMLYKPVACTMGPKGKTVIISNLLDRGRYTKDGVTVANEIECTSDQFINAAIKIFREAANKTVKDAGDGTTTSTVLLYNLINEVNRRMKDGQNIVDLKKQLVEELGLCVDEIKKIAVPLVVDGKPDIKKISQLATTSANGDTFIGGMIAEAYEKVGAGVAISVRETQKQTYLETVSGMRLDVGYASQYFANIAGTIGCAYSDALVFVTDKAITKNGDMLKFLDYANTARLPLILFCTDIAGEALGTLNSNIPQGLQACAVSISLGIRGTRDVLKDIAIFAGAKFCSSETGYNIDNISDEEVPNYLGSLKKFECTDEFSILAGGAGSPESIAARVAEIVEKITPDSSDYDREELLSRKSKLTGGFAVLNIGGKTPGEVKELRDRCDDAVLAVRSAIEEGYLPGCGKAYLYAFVEMPVHNPILGSALQSITEQVCSNGDYKNVKEIMDSMCLSAVHTGFNASTGTMEDLIEAGVIDSAKVAISALQNAVSTALAFLNTECISAEFKD
jgi:chaperonin GroEL